MNPINTRQQEVHENIEDICLEDLCLELENDLKNLRDIKKKDKEKKLKDIKDMIRFYVDSTRDVEERRIRIAETSWQSMLIIVGIATICFSVNMPIIIKLMVFLALLYPFIQQFRIIHEYFEQAGYKYVFLSENKLLDKFSNKWKWFYYGNKYITNISTDSFNRSKILNDEKYYISGLKYFIDNYINENIDSEIENGIQQLYLLQVHNFYKNKFYLRLRNREMEIIYSLPKILLFILWMTFVVLLLIFIIRFDLPVLYERFF
jgi:hypothetical protein